MAKDCTGKALLDEDGDEQRCRKGKPISRTAQYKLAGNSIVTACLENIFEQLFPPKSAWDTGWWMNNWPPDETDDIWNTVNPPYGCNHTEDFPVHSSNLLTANGLPYCLTVLSFVVTFPDAIIHFFDLSIPCIILNQPNDQENDNKHANIGKDSAH